MFDAELVIKSSGKAHRAPAFISAREAERILGISRAVLNKLAKAGRLRGELVEKAGKRRAWRFRPKEVQRLKQEGTALRRPARLRRIRAAWVNFFGPIPRGYTVFSRDGSHNNVSPANLALAPVRERINSARKRLGRHACLAPHRWTREQRDVLRTQFATRPTEELAAQFGVTVTSVRAQASRMRLRKALQYIVERARAGRRQPIGTERLCTHDKNEGIVLVKVANVGTQAQQWRPKNHLVWEQHHGRPVPPGMRVIFKDGNRANFDPRNLDLATRWEIASREFAKFLSYPAPLQGAIRASAKLRREIARRQLGLEISRGRRGGIGAPKGRKRPHWTPAMDEYLCRSYATEPTQAIVKKLSVSLSAVRMKARRLGLRKDPKAMVAEAAAQAAIQKRKALRDHNAQHQ